MEFQRTWLWAALGGVILLVVVVVFVPDVQLRALLSVLAIVPLLYVTVRAILGSERRAAQDRRRYTKLRNQADEFIMHVRNLNRITVIANGEDPPEDAAGMIDEIVTRMHSLVDRMRDAAGEQDRLLSEEDRG